jgi:energy-coupling factor transporter ATP-binding protein EcfA2
MQYPDIDTAGIQWSIRSYPDVWAELLGRRQAGSTLVIGIDGHSGSGKTSLANGLAALEPHALVVHTDDLAWRHSLFGWGELLVDHVLVPLRQGRTPIAYRPESWIQRNREGAITIPSDATVVLVEGVGAARQKVRSMLDAVVWVHARPDVARRRVIAKGMHTEQLVDDCMHQENAFLEQDRPWEVADVLVAGELGQPSLTGKYGNVVTAPGPGQRETPRFESPEDSPSPRA